VKATAVGEDAPPCSDDRTAEFKALSEAAGVTGSLELLSSGPPRYSGLFSKAEAVRGQVTSFPLHVNKNGHK
jgi:hypothetical protein